jgi:hypothetical protein
MLNLSGVTESSSQDRFVIPATGSLVTPEWKQYNEQAEAKGAPLLKYVVTAKEMTRTKEREPKDIQDTFSLKDDLLYVYTAWVNVKDRAKNEIKIYDPRGVLFYRAEKVYRFSTEKWTVWDPLYLSGWPATRLPGKWQAQIFMNGTLAKTKEFEIGSETRRYERKSIKESSPSIGVYPIFVDAESKYGATFRNNSSLMPLYISQMLTIDFEDRRLVMPFDLRSGMISPKVKYDDFGKFLTQEVKSPDSEWDAMIKKHGLDVLIAGKVYDTTAYEEEKEATIYVVKTGTKDIKEIKASYKSMKAFDKTGFQVRANFYREVYDQIIKQAADLLK